MIYGVVDSMDVQVQHTVHTVRNASLAQDREIQPDLAELSEYVRSYIIECTSIRRGVRRPPQIWLRHRFGSVY